MKTNSNFLTGIVISALLAVMVFFSCNKEKIKDEQATTGQCCAKDSAALKQADADEGLFEEQREKLLAKVNIEAEKAGKKIVELKIEQAKAKVKIREGIEKDIKTLQDRKEKLEMIWNGLKTASKEGLKKYEEEIEKILKE